MSEEGTSSFGAFTPHLFNDGAGNGGGGGCLHARREKGERFAVFARVDTSGWVEGCALEAYSSAEAAKFLFQDVICRHGYPGRIVMDRGPENKETKYLLALHGIRRVPISAYHPQSNGLVERGHGPVVNSVAKYCQ